MILEETTGDVSVTLEGKTISVGTSFEDTKYPQVVVTGKGKAIFRVDQNSTAERYGIKMSKQEGVAPPIVVPPPPPPPILVPEPAPVVQPVAQEAAPEAPKAE